mgnify:CR=1 FL=1
MPSIRCSLLPVLLLAASSNAEVRLPKIFTSHMVVQQGLPVTVWGWADAGEKVTVSLAGASASAAADENGAWRVTLPALKADAAAQTLVV